MNIESKVWITRLNKLGVHRIPFFFMIDFEKNHPIIIPLDELGDDVSIQFPNFRHNNRVINPQPNFVFEKKPIAFEEYKEGFDIVKNNLKYGNSFLANYTCRSAIHSNKSLQEIYAMAEAKFKLNVRDKFTVFSPERFVKIENGYIYSYPMKGTIDASIDNAKETILNDQKELAEHYTIVDLIRNDLSRVAKQVQVSNFRYIDKIKSNNKNLLQVSSEVRGTLSNDHLDHLGYIIDQLLPAGSISGAPKKKTIEVIQQAEGKPRGMYTGIFGIFDGISLDSAVAIRFVENVGGQLYYRSGGGITHQSNARSEYNEMIDKIYVPINREHQDIQRQSIQHTMAQLAV